MNESRRTGRSMLRGPEAGWFVVVLLLAIIAAGTGAVIDAMNRPKPVMMPSTAALSRQIEMQSTEITVLQNRVLELEAHQSPDATIAPQSYSGGARLLRVVATGTPTPTPAPTSTPKPAKKKGWVHYSVAHNKAVIRAEGKRAAYGNANIDALLWICKRESRFHNWSHSRSECHGLFQLSKGMAHGHPWGDPVWNTRRAIRYIRHRYGSPLKAKAFWQKHSWY